MTASFKSYHRPRNHKNGCEILETEVHHRHLTSWVITQFRHDPMLECPRRSVNVHGELPPWASEKRFKFARPQVEVAIKDGDSIGSKKLRRISRPLQTYVQEAQTTKLRVLQQTRRHGSSSIVWGLPLQVKLMDGESVHHEATGLCRTSQTQRTSSGDRSDTRMRQTWAVALPKVINDEQMYTKGVVRHCPHQANHPDTTKNHACSHERDPR
mmetsp:Transcript_42681/g.112633  ORF Transcript_42681/g.112633 Transcript_42681/m.112633 type:complete len:212 (-) Transcript_42681:1238-1873(-)